MTLSTRVIESMARIGTAALGLTLAALAPAWSQQLEPRAYSPSPVGANFIGISYAHQSGDVLSDPTLPLTDVNARVNMAVPFYGRTFGLFGRASSVGILLPYAWGTVDGNLGETYRRADRSGFADPTVRFSINLLGGPALTPREFAARKPATTLGFSLSAVVPVGQYYPDKLVNLGTNRWAAKPELGLSAPIGDWTLELYLGAWLFATNTEFFGGQSRQQDPLYSEQFHVIYTVKPRCWIALDMTHYSGGQTTLGGTVKDDRANNSRAGVTVSLPLNPKHSLKFSYAKGVTARSGSKLDTLAIAWQYFWLSGR